MKKSSIVIADKLPILHFAWQQLLTQANEIELVGEARDGERAQQLCQENQPQVLLLDVLLPGPSAIETVHFVQDNCPDTKILIFTNDFETCDSRGLVEMGIAGCLFKHETTQNMLQAIHSVAGGQTWFNHSMMKTLLLPKKSSTKATSLTELQLKILQLMASDQTGEHMAKVLHISPRMLRKYSRELYDKLAVNTRTGAVAAGFRQGLIQ